MALKTKLLVLFLLFTATVTRAQSTNDPIRAGVAQGNWSSVVSEVTMVCGSDPNGFQANNDD